MNDAAKSGASIPRQLVVQLRNARIGVIGIGILGTAGGIVLLPLFVFALLTSPHMKINSADIGLLVSVLGGFVICMGLWSLSDTARGAGALWFLLWGLINAATAVFLLATANNPSILVVGFVGGVALLQIAFGEVLRSLPATFVCRYLKRKPLELTPVLESLEAALQDKQARMRNYAASLLEKIRGQE